MTAPKRLAVPLALVVYLCGVQSLASEIHQAAAAGNIEQLGALLNENPALVREPDTAQSLPLHLAALNGHIEAVRLLVEHGADVSAPDRERTTPLICACMRGHREVAEFLLGRGATVAERDDLGKTPLLAAVTSGNLDLVELLVEKGANVAERTNDNESTLHNAALGGNVEVVTYLLDAGLEVNDLNVDHQTPLFYASSRGRIDVIRLLVERGADLNIRDKDSVSALGAAAYQGRTGSIETLLNLGANVNEAPNRWGMSPLIAAMWSNRVPAFELLIDQGAVLDRSTGASQTVLHVAAESGKMDFAEVLLNKGSDINAADDFGWSPLGRAALWQPAMALWLIERGASVNALNDTVASPLQAAARGGDTSLVRMLLAKGADPNWHGGGWEYPLHPAITGGHAGVVGILLEAGANPNLRDEHLGATSLHKAVLAGCLSLVEPLLNHGADIQVLDTLGHTALYYAERYGHASIAGLLKARGATLSSGDELVPQNHNLAQPVPTGEAVVWYLKNSAWAVRTNQHVLILDYFASQPSPDQPSLANGRIIPSDLANEEVLVFSSHEHGDHYDSTIFAWRNQIPKIAYIFGHQPPDLTGYEYMAPRTERTFGNVKVQTIRATDAGVGFLVEVDGVVIYHAGDHANGVVGLHAPYTDEIDYLSSMGKSIDLAFMPISGCSLGTPESVKEGVYYALRKLQPKVFFPQHAMNAEFRLREFADQARADGFTTQTCAAQNPGDSFRISAQRNP
jgi:ankyrin repeat protein/L-ascorbate metabolism protein UlaG (beta-lactamase superfamily)